MLRVIDISDAQAGLDLSTIANQFDAVMIKATGGNGYVNPSCDAHVQQAIALGKKWGVYHYFSDGYNDNDPVVEANWFVDNCLGYVGKGILALDWERGGNPQPTNTAMAAQWAAQVKARTNVNPLDYMSLSLVTSLDWSASINAGDGLWCAAYVDDNTPIPNFGMDPNRDPNPTWDGQVNDVMWQFTSTGRLDGYGGNLDCSFFYGTSATWDAYAGTNTAVPPTPVPAPPTPPAPDPTPPEPTPPVPPVDPNPAPNPDPSPTPAPTPEPQPQPPDTTPTTTDNPSPPVNNSGIWAVIVAFFAAIYNWLKG